MPIRFLTLALGLLLALGAVPAYGQSRSGSRAAVSRTSKAKAQRTRSAARNKRAERIRDVQRNLWRKTKDFKVKAKSERVSLTFSFDSELPHSDAYALVMADRGQAAKLRAAAAEMPLQRNQLREILSMSDKQLDTFAFKKGVDTKSSQFLLTDLHPKVFAAAYNSLLASPESSALRNQMRESVETILSKKMKLPIELHYDGGFLEVTHRSWESVPQKFRKLVVEQLHEIFENPQTHLHIGIPGELSNSALTAVARAVETRLILAFASAAPEIRTRPRYKNSSLVDYELDDGGTGRGFINVGPREWSSPRTTHNLEIRQWQSIDQGLESLSFAAALAANHARLRRFRDFRRGDVEDEHSINLNGALRYAAMALGESGRPGDTELSRQMHRFSDAMEREGRVTPALRKQVYEFLNAENVVERLDADVFVR